MDNKPLTDLLILRLKDPSPEVAHAALTLLRRESLLFFGALHGVDLRGADLSGMDFAGADFTGADFTDTNFTKTLMFEVNLYDANLLRANLTEADLRFSNLTAASNLTLDQLKSVARLEGCTLPDGTRLPQRIEMGDPEPDWRTPFADWCERHS